MFYIISKNTILERLSLLLLFFETDVMYKFGDLRIIAPLLKYQFMAITSQ